MLLKYEKKIEDTRFSGLWVFCFLWAVIFVLYLPAARSGMEGDFPYWVLSTRESFGDYVNTRSSSVHSLYQFTEIAMYCIYKLFGLNAWLWHLLQVTLHAVVCLLLYHLCRTIFTDSRTGYPNITAFAGTFLFCIAPHASEVVVRESCYHYLQGFIFILAILTWMVRYLKTGQPKYAWYAGVVYAISIFSLEIFYLTPLYVLAVAVYYRLVLNYDKKAFRSTLSLFLIPQLLLFCLHLALMRMVWGNGIAHVGLPKFSDPIIYFNRQIMYLFHIVCLGRYFPEQVKGKIYALCNSAPVVIAFYCVVALIGCLVVRYSSRMQAKSKAVVLFLIMAALAICMLIPLDFPGTLYIIGDRYNYVPFAFISMAFVLMISFIPYRFVAFLVYSIYLLFNLYYTVKTNVYWHRSASITRKLLTTVPVEANKKLLLLNLPTSMRGALMIRTHDPSEFKLMNNLFYEKNKVTNDVYDVCAYNMIHREDGAHVTVCNDSVVHVTLNQWGSWWWNGDLGASSYENDQFKMNMTDVGHWYELTLRHPASEYLMLYQVGDQWKVVDWSKKNVDQN